MVFSRPFDAAIQCAIDATYCNAFNATVDPAQCEAVHAAIDTTIDATIKSTLCATHHSAHDAADYYSDLSAI